MKIKILSLSRNVDFKNLLGGKKFPNKYLTIFYKKLKKKSFRCLNIGLVVKKKLGGAVVRNKIKRRLRGIVREGLKTNDIQIEYSYLFIAKKNVFEDKYNVIKEKVLKDLKKIK